MKLNVTCLDCEITVEEVDGKCVVTATQNGEVVEEFELECSETDNDSEEEEIDMDVDVDVDVDIEDEADEDEDEADEDEDLNESVKTFDDFFKKVKK